MASNKKEKYTVSDELLVDVNLVIKVDMSALGIYPEFMDNKRIKQIVLSEIDEAMRLSQALSPVTYNVKSLNTMYQSKPVKTDKKIKDDWEN